MFLAQFEKLQLSRLQKRIVAAGMGERELSQSSIHRAMKTEDRDTYDQEVTGLRKIGVLVETRSALKAGALAKSSNRKKSEIGRFQVVLPQSRIAMKTPSDAGRPGAKVTHVEKPTGVEVGPAPKQLFPEGTGVYIANPPARATPTDLEELLTRFGKVRDVRLSRAN